MTQPELFLEASFASLDLDKLLPPLPNASKRLLHCAALCGARPGEHASRENVGSSRGRKHIKHELYEARNLDMKWNLSDVTPDLARVSGTATLRQGEGKFLNAEKLASLSNTARLALLPIVTLQKLDRDGALQRIGLPSLQKIPFNSLQGNYLLQSGVMKVQTFDLTGSDLGLHTEGTIGLSGLQPINLRVQMKLAPGKLGGDLGQILQDAEGRPTVNFSATGSVAEPRVRLELQEAGRKALERAGEKIFKGLFGQPKSTTATQTDQNSSASSDPVKDLQENLRRIFR